MAFRKALAAGPMMRRPEAALRWPDLLRMRPRPPSQRPLLPRLGARAGDAIAPFIPCARPPPAAGRSSGPALRSRAIAAPFSPTPERRHRWPRILRREGTLRMNYMRSTATARKAFGHPNTPAFLCIAVAGTFTLAGPHTWPHSRSFGSSTKRTRAPPDTC